MDRLTDRTRNHGIYLTGQNKGATGYVPDDVLKRLAAYEDAEEQGLLVRLPCKAGERWMRDGKQYIVAEISVTSAWGIMVRHYEEGNGKMLSCNPQYFAKHYTRAEAEEALKGERHETD